MKSKLAPLTGVIFFVVLVLSFVVSGGDPPEAKEGAAKVAEHYTDNHDSIVIGAAMSVFAALFLVFFAGYLRKVLAAAEGPGGWLAPIAFTGLVIVAIGASIDAMLSFAIAEAADKGVDDSALLPIQAIWDNDFFPLALGVAVFLWALGLSVLRHGTLPRWIGYVAVVAAIAATSPAGFVSVIVAGLLVLVISIILTMREGSVDPQPAA